MEVASPDKVSIQLSFIENSANPDQTPRVAASGLGLHCLPMPYFWDARH